MFGFFTKNKLVKDDLRGIATLMYKDVSSDPWDQENLTGRKLDFTVESVRTIDLYSQRLMTTEDGLKLMNQYFDNFVVRIGAYLGQVIRYSIYDNDFQWYEFNSVNSYSSKLSENDRRPETDTVLYSKKRDIVLFPIADAELFLEGNSTYPTLLNYVEETIKLNT